MLIFKGSQVIKHYVMFAFLFVQTVDTESVFFTSKHATFISWGLWSSGKTQDLVSKGP